MYCGRQQLTPAAQIWALTPDSRLLTTDSWSYLPCSSKNFSASMAAMQPLPDAVMA